MLQLVLFCICLASAKALPAANLSLSVSIQLPTNPVPGLPVLLPNPGSITFYLYNNISQYGTYQSGVQLIATDNSTLQNTGIDPTKPLIVLVHGFLQNYKCNFPQDIKDAYLALNQSISVIVVDYGDIACGGVDQTIGALCFPRAALSVDTVGEAISDLLYALSLQGVVNDDTLRIVGVSLGAHVSGGAGHHYQVDHKRTISRITGLDPGGPSATCGGARCLSSTDAKFVDIIHTDMGFYGTTANLGQINFFANGGGHPQPGCEGQADLCSHASVASYWLQSIGSSNLKGYLCDSYGDYNSGKCGPSSDSNAAIFGDNAVPAPYGNYYLNITKAPLTNRYSCYVNILPPLPIG